MPSFVCFVLCIGFRITLKAKGVPKTLNKLPSLKLVSEFFSQIISLKRKIKRFKMFQLIINCVNFEKKNRASKI